MFSGADRRAAPFGRIDPAGLVVTIVAAIVYLLHGFQGPLSRDLGVYTYAGQRFAEGVPPYEGILNRSGPLSHLLPGLGVWAGRQVGADDLIAARFLFFLISLACVYVAYLLGREALGTRWAGVLAGFGLLTFGGFLTLATGGPREKTPMVLFLELAVLCALQRRWWWVGLWTSLGTLTWQPVFFPALAAALAALVLVEPRGRRWLGLLAVTLSGLAPLAGFLAWYAARGELRYFLDCFVLIHLEYTQQVGALRRLPLTWTELQGGFGATVWVFLVGLAASLVAPLVVAVWPRLRRSPHGRAVLVVGVASWAGMAWSSRAFNGWPDAFVLLPTAAIGLSMLVWPVWRLLPDRAAGVATLVLGALAYGLAAHFALTTRTDELVGERARAEAAAAVVGPDANFLSLQAPQTMVLADRVNPIRHQMLDLGLVDYIDATWPGGLTGLGEWISQTRPTVVLTQYSVEEAWLDPVLAADYRRCGRGDHVKWYLTLDADPALCEQIEAIVTSAPE